MRSRWTCRCRARRRRSRGGGADRVLRPALRREPSRGSRRHGVAIVSGSMSAMTPRQSGSARRLLATRGNGQHRRPAGHDGIGRPRPGHRLGPRCRRAARHVEPAHQDRGRPGHRRVGPVRLRRRGPAAGIAVHGEAAAAAWPYLLVSAGVHVLYVRALVRGLRPRRLLARLSAGTVGALTAALLGVLARAGRRARGGRLGGTGRGDDRAGVAHPTGHAAQRGRVHAADGGADRQLHRARHRGIPAHDRRLRLRRRAHGGHRARPLGRGPHTRSGTGIRSRRCGCRGSGTWCRASAWRPRTRSSWWPCATRRSATSRRCGSRPWCSAPRSAGSCSRNGWAAGGWRRAAIVTVGLVALVLSQT